MRGLRLESRKIQLKGVLYLNIKDFLGEIYELSKC